jgi:tRNA dimethylallyltransferase
MAPPTARRSPGPPAPPPLAAIVGPTGSGKSDLALALAERLPIEIVVADSRQVYRGMDVGTAKPDASARARVPHHLLDLVSPDQPFTLADWLERVRAVLPEIARRGRIPLVVGGTGLYLSALVDGYDLGAQPWSPHVRARLLAELESEGLEPLAERLARLDPAAAARTDLRNPRRVLRALERLEGDSASLRIGRAGGVPYPGRVGIIGISRPRDVLYRRIDARAATLFAGGLLDEVRGLLAAGYTPDLEPMTGHGYREAARVVVGEWDTARAVEVTARHTRQYAKRQLSWFRRDPRIVWLPAGDRPADDPAFVARADEVLRALLA